VMALCANTVLFMTSTNKEDQATANQCPFGFICTSQAHGGLYVTDRCRTIRHRRGENYGAAIALLQAFASAR
jgi:hypothetical protein